MRDDGLGAGRRRRRPLLLAGLALIAALLGGLAWRGRAAGGATTAPAVALAAQALARGPAGDANTGPRAVAAAASGPASSASAAVAASTARARDDAGAATVCDLAAASAAGPSAAPGDDDVLAATLRAGLRNARQALRASADPEVRALAVLLDARGGGDAVALVADRAALAREAAQSSDPRLYRMALQACGGQPAGADRGACGLLEPARWAQLDADNAMPWLALLAADGASGSTTDTSAALFHAVHAARIDDDYGLYPALIERGLPPDTPRWLRQRLQILAIGLQGAEPAPQFLTISRLCSAAALADANRAQDCDTLARHLVTRGRTLMALLVGRRVGERLHWRADRLQALAQQAQAILAVQQQWTWDAAASDCASAERQRHWVQQIGRLGEIGAARAAIDASGLDSAHWVQRAAGREQARRARQVAELATAASAAEAASAAAARAGG